jgi:hypothetical protein
MEPGAGAKRRINGKCLVTTWGSFGVEVAESSSLGAH